MENTQPLFTVDNGVFCRCGHHFLLHGALTRKCTDPACHCDYFIPETKEELKVDERLKPVYPQAQAVERPLEEKVQGGVSPTVVEIKRLQMEIDELKKNREYKKECLKNHRRELTALALRLFEIILQVE